MKHTKRFSPKTLSGSRLALFALLGMGVVSPESNAQTGTFTQQEQSFADLLTAFDAEGAAQPEAVGEDDSFLKDDSALKDDAQLPSPDDEATPSRADDETRKSELNDLLDSVRNRSDAEDELNEAKGDEQDELVQEQVADSSLDNLSLADVIASLYRSFPEIQRARQERIIAGGERLSAYGSYDTKFQAHSLSEPTGFYRNYRNGLGVARQTWWGGYVAAGYRIGRGFYQPWYKERQTDDAGEFKLAVAQPLLRGRAIDPQRVAVFQANLAQQAADPKVQLAILESSQQAATIYWDWVLSGVVLNAQQELLRIAEIRAEQIKVGVKAGKFAEVDLIFNDQLIAERRAETLKAEQKFRATSFKLGVFLRDDLGQPMIPDDAWLPKRYPEISLPPGSDFDSELAAAIGRRPEPQLLQFELRHVQLDRQLACNDTLPTFNFVAEASQDMGEPSTKSDDKGEFELVIGFMSEVPIQRRKARGKVQSTTAKIAQINQKLRLTRDKIAAELMTARNALEQTNQIVEQNERSLTAARDVLKRYRFAFDKGKIDLIYLNLLETKATEVEIKLAMARREWFVELATLQFALGLDPLERAMLISASVE